MRVESSEERGERTCFSPLCSTSLHSSPRNAQTRSPLPAASISRAIFFAFGAKNHLKNRDLPEKIAPKMHRNCTAVCTRERKKPEPKTEVRRGRDLSALLNRGELLPTLTLDRSPALVPRLQTLDSFSYALSRIMTSWGRAFMRAVLITFVRHGTPWRATARQVTPRNVTKQVLTRVCQA